MPPTKVVHVSVPPPVCDGCTKDGSLSCNLACPRCKRLVTSRSTTIPQLFAILRQWEPATQDNVDLIVAEMFKKGLNVDDRDSLTDMTVLHFACKAGGIGDPKKSARLVEDLLRRNADVTLAPKWTQMTPLHLAAFFSNAPAITVLMPKAQAIISATCTEFEGATPLHLAALAGSVQAVHTLLRHGADSGARDAHRRTPLDCAKFMASQQTDISQSAWTTIISQV